MTCAMMDTAISAGAYTRADVSAALWWMAVGAVVFAVNLLPAFGPPTWAVLVWFHVAHHLAAAPLVAIGVVAAASGRALLAIASRRAGAHLGPRIRARVERARRTIAGRRHPWAVLAVFLVSPVPSAQLFVAAGIMRLRLRPLLGAFALGRTASYTAYLVAASTVDQRLGSVITSSLTSPAGIAVQLGLLVLAVALPATDWSRAVDALHHRARGEGPVDRPDRRPPEAP